ncbi:tigger transposable element-derived protein 6-like [Ornithodoros turicata]|uniref:tigger transposable element-derived protein 6-like n=1 Tax=Ornithodoros turicata TaxID=34597 RepID=UPI00313A3E4B
MLKSIKLEFLPANATAVIQPMDQDVIQNLNVFYRRQLLHRILLCADNNKDYGIDLLSAPHILTNAWAQVKPVTVQDRCHYAGFAQDLSPVCNTLCDDDDSDADTVFSEIAGTTTFTRDEYEMVDSTLATCREEKLEELIAEVQNKDNSSIDDDDEIEDTVRQTVPQHEAWHAVLKRQQ